jgi:hypothetical protein
MKDLIYYPSLSAGGCAGDFKKNKEVKPGLSCRFYSKEFPERWRHPYFLITAGHHYKWMDARDRYGLDEDVLVLGDSGGFQLATGAIKWDPTFKKTIFDWLEANCDLGVNLDIPPRAKYDGKFYECMDISYDNFKYFADNQTGKCKFLNVIQGNNVDEYDAWYQKMKDFEFNGWCIGGAQKRVSMFMSALAPMLKNREFEKERNQYVHVLGISKISDFFMLSFFQKMLNKYHGGRIQVSTDSSSPGLYPVYGTYLHSPQLSKMTFTDLYFPKGEDLPYNAEDLVPNPLGHPVSEGFTFGDVSNYKGDVTMKMTLNNLFVFNETVKQVEEIVKCHNELLQTVVPRDFYSILMSMEEMFKNPDNAVNIYEQNSQLYDKFGGGTRDLVNNQVISQFFEIG